MEVNDFMPPYICDLSYMFTDSCRGEFFFIPFFHHKAGGSF